MFAQYEKKMKKRQTPHGSSRLRVHITICGYYPTSSLDSYAIHWKLNKDDQRLGKPLSPEFIKEMKLLDFEVYWIKSYSQVQQSLPAQMEKFRF